MTGDAAKSPFGFIRFRDTRRAAERAGRYSLVVRALRWVLPLGVVVALVVLVVWPMVRNREVASDLVKALPVPNLVVDNLTLTGLDEQSQPYSLTARRALQAVGLSDVVDLEEPSGDIALKDGAWLSGRARQGRFDQKNRQLWLGGDVEVFRDDGFQFTSAEAQVDLARFLMWSDKPVRLQGSFGIVTGQGMRVLDHGSVVVIRGPATARLALAVRG